MQSKIEQQVMASVGVIYVTRQFASAPALKLYAVALSAVALWQFTWVTRVFENWSQVGVEGTLNFVTSAIVHTHMPVQLALLVALFAGVSLVRDLLKPTHTYRLA